MNGLWKMIDKSRMLIFLGLLMIGIVFISGCVQEKAPTPVITQSPTIVPATQPSAATPAGTATQVSSSTSTLIVDKNGGANYTRIQDALNNSNDGDTILVHSGTYYESVGVDKKLILIGVDTGGGKPVVNASRSDSPTGAIDLNAGNSVLEGFMVTGATYHEMYYSAGIRVDSRNNQIRNNTVLNNPNGITLYLSSNNTLSGNNISNNDNGIYLFASNNNMLSGNDASKNKNLGIYVYSSSNNTLIGNSVIDNNYGIVLWYSVNNTIYNNLFKNRENIKSLDTLLHNTWNTTKQPSVNIIGGQYLGGNFWANTGRIDISITCSDNDHDGLCDSPYKLDDNNSDYLPLAYKSGMRY
jgi:parallel beta-helix repeat protein